VLSRHAYADAVVIGRFLPVKALIARPMRQVQMLGTDGLLLEAGHGNQPSCQAFLLSLILSFQARV
jgi:hypothetical protein